MDFPLANSSINLSKYRIFRIRSSSISSTRYPQITPVIFETLGWMWACVKKVNKSLFSSKCCCNVFESKPVSQKMIWSTSSLVRCFFQLWQCSVDKHWQRSFCTPALNFSWTRNLIKFKKKKSIEHLIDFCWS